MPSNFTAPTGAAHWEVLLRARAIENQVYVIAPAQWGQHTPRYRSHGHSLIVDPWGTVVADKGHGEGMCLAEIDHERIAGVRRSIPVRDHRRL